MQDCGRYDFSECKKKNGGPLKHLTANVPRMDKTDTFLRDHPIIIHVS
jgi:hypothetical protein